MMWQMLLIMRAVVFGFMNRARGSQFYSILNSDTEGRLVSMLVMAIAAIGPLQHPHFVAVCFVAWMLLYGWTILGWDAYWSAAIGNDPNHSKLWGIGWMTLRQGGMLLPYYSFLAGLTGDWWNLLYALSALSCGVMYTIWGIFAPNVVVRNAEFSNGLVMGVTTHFILNGGL